ncbi:uncharacterized protein PHACADRAFT_169805 [Phanerochaete carnosa HHB-10118-sp]|uniref:Uncharacterized protein n=1 Tax=Phanerochaete carnosa (strain HHB-10118-sp) TaxID=650164 RepID=K5X8U5_PHACS|nr:uncharacterized protein PHACADRAFT_169805 [Phanerochaete carnosa HHB-10118-sp]EKM59287.1 hypothetical protein PHACADRAFT_169805 [Phanerochaete carnosa HHB-10118-sp]
MICQQMGRHVHIDYCRTPVGQTCGGKGLQHCTARVAPEPMRPKDFVSHKLYWRRTGFKDPYSNEDRDAFAKCDAICMDREHQTEANSSAQPSYCTLPIFHASLNPARTPPGGVGYISGDGHHFSCHNPALLQQAFYV